MLRTRQSTKTTGNLHAGTLSDVRPVMRTKLYLSFERFRHIEMADSVEPPVSRRVITCTMVFRLSGFRATAIIDEPKSSFPALARATACQKEYNRRFAATTNNAPNLP